MVDFCMVTPGGGLVGGPEGPPKDPGPAPDTLMSFPPAVIARAPPEPRGTFIC